MAPGQSGGDPAVRHPRRQDDRTRRVPAGGRARGDGHRGADKLRRAVLRGAGRCRATSTCRATIADIADVEAFSPIAGRAVHVRVPQRGEKRELLALAARNAAETLAREQPLAGRPRQDARRARGAGGGLGLPGRRSASSATTSATSRARSRSAAWSSSRTASRAAGIPAVPDPDGPGPNDFASHQEVLRRRFRVVKNGEEGGEAPLGDAGPRHRGRRQGPGQRGQGGPRRARAPRPAAGGPGQGTRRAVPARSRRSGGPARDVARALSRPAAARRGPPVRDHLPPRPARPAERPVRVRRPARCRARRKRELLKVFGSIKRVRDAPVEQIAAVPGIGPSLAARIKATLEA